MLDIDNGERTALTPDERITRFNAYADAFEQAYASDDWTVLERFFTSDATSELNGARVDGRANVLASFRDAVAMFDRRFDAREMRFVDGPRLEDGAVYIKAVGTYRRGGLEPLALVGEEWFHFEGDRIARHVDRVLNVAEVMGYLGTHAAELRPFVAAADEARA